MIGQLKKKIMWTRITSDGFAENQETTKEELTEKGYERLLDLFANDEIWGKEKERVVITTTEARKKMWDAIAGREYVKGEVEDTRMLIGFVYREEE